jgi:hypothetical protein
VARNPATKQVRAAEGPYKALLESVAHAGGPWKWNKPEFRTCPEVKAILSLERPQQREVLRALFHEIGAEAERIEGPRDDPYTWCNMHYGRDAFNAYCMVASWLLRRDLKLTCEDWLAILKDLNQFPFIYIGLSHDYMNAMLGRLESDAKTWTDLPKPLRAAIRRVARAIERASDNAPQIKAAERLEAVVRRFDIAKERATVRNKIERPATRVAPVASPPKQPSVAERERVEGLLAQLEAEVRTSFETGVWGRWDYPSRDALKEVQVDAPAVLVRSLIPSLALSHGRCGRQISDQWHVYSRMCSLLTDVLATWLRKGRFKSPSDLDMVCDATINHEASGAGSIMLLVPMIRAVQLFGSRQPITPTMRRWLVFARQAWADIHDFRLREPIVKALLGEDTSIELDLGEPWAARAVAEVEKASPRARGAWAELIDHCVGAKSSSPSAKWLTRAGELVKIIGRARFEASLLTWLPLVRQGRTKAHGKGWARIPAGSILLREQSQLVLRGLCWAASMEPRRAPDIARALGSLVLDAFRKVPGRGPAAVMLGNAGIGALGRMGGPDALAQLAMLRVKVKFGTGQKMLEKALDGAAARSGLPRAEIEELAVPSYGMTEIGLRREMLGEFAAELRVSGTGHVELTFARRTAGDAPARPLKSVPAAVKQEHASELAELKAAAKDIGRMISAQRDRIDALFAERKSWPLQSWRDRYLDHPLIGLLARRLIWTFSTPGREPRDGTWLEGPASLVDARGRTITVPDDASVSLWHPIGRSVEEVVSWRRFFEDREIRQPFKQAHREVYVLTEAERRTQTYSNRFAAHILRQHQFSALCAARGWKNKLRLMVDAEYPPASRELSAFGLRAEFWIEGAGDEYGEHTNEAGVYHFLSTDQVRFYRLGTPTRMAHAGGGGYAPLTPAEEGEATAPLPLELVPPLALSEVMRDVDLFVGVTSIGNNPDWFDGGPEGRHRDYWWSFAFGEMSEVARSRHDILARLLPRLRIAGACRLEESFLVVKGSLRTYKIHLGSANILMEPDDQYLCIHASGVRDGAAAPGVLVPGGVFLPFEGDRTLSIILSKAFLLAADGEITDPTITRQIHQRQ